MARSRELVLKEGKVSLNGFSTEVADKIETMLTNMDKPQATQTPTSQMTEVAIGLYHNKEKNLYEVVSFKFDGATKQVAYEETVVAGDSKRIGINKFKTECVRKGVIK